MGEKYYLCGSGFHFQVENGILVSAEAAGDSDRTPYLNEKEGYGRLFLVWRQNGEVRRWQPLAAASPSGSSGTAACGTGIFEDAAPERRGRSMCYMGSIGNGDLRVTVRYFLGGESLDHEVLVENTSSEPLELLDFGVGLFCHSEFEQSKDMGREVLGHHFIAGHGSHSTLYRCDGKGKILAVMPWRDSKWIHYEMEEAYADEERDGERGRVILYGLDGYTGKRREAAGARLRIPPESVTLEPGEKYRYCGKLLWAADYEDCKRKLAGFGQVMAESVPGYTVPREQPVLLALQSSAEEISVEARAADVETLGENGEYRLYRLHFKRLGEHSVRVCHDGKYTELYYFVTEDIRTLLRKRAAFIASGQVRDEGKWYNGLLTEYNNATGAVHGPDNYDKIGGWRIYEVSCDDPGLSKPAFLSTAQTVEPRQDQVDALDYYIEHFVWGGLQQTEEEPFPYGIYGIPDWHRLRNSEDPGLGGRMHLWRVYDYPHIALLYYNMYEVAAFAEGITTKLDALTYLRRAYGTARALFTVPAELEGWTAYETGFYNELVIEKIIAALKREGMDREARILEAHWNRKAYCFVGNSGDVFRSEYAFDTTGFESTHVLAARGFSLARIHGRKPPYGEDISLSQAVEFMEAQTACNIACRGMLEPAYFWYGSDYRGNNLHYTLSYMTQMGGCSLLDYACYYAERPFEILRLAYGSLLGSWALLNSGDEESGYGYWFPGREKDGCACGGFEPLYGGKTWLDQPHTGGAWYYSCEIDLGFCGGLRGACSVLADDPVFGRICYGAVLTREEEGLRISRRDGVGRKFHYIGEKGRIHAECIHGSWEPEDGIVLSEDCGRIVLKASSGPWKKESLSLRVMLEELGDYSLAGTGRVLRDSEWTEIPLPEGSGQIVLEKI